MRAPGRHTSDDELFAWFVAAVSTTEQPAHETADGVVDVRLADLHGRQRRVELLLTREQLRAHAWSDYEMADAHAGTSDTLADDPVRAGLEALAMYAARELSALRPDEHYLVLHRRRFEGSVRRDLPPVPGQPLRGRWSTSSREGEPPGRVSASFADYQADEEELERVYAAARPSLRPGVHAVTTVRSVPAGVTPVLTVHEPEGTTLVLEQQEADRLGLPYAVPVAVVTLQTRSSLATVGVTQDIAAALSRWRIPCSVVAGFFHDHVLVPVQHGERAVALLGELTSSA